jgi:hypothetical protein
MHAHPTFGVVREGITLGRLSAPARKDLGAFIERMMFKYGRGASDEGARQQLLDWFDRLKATERVTAPSSDDGRMGRV